MLNFWPLILKWTEGLELFMDIFIGLAYSTLSSAEQSCSSEITVIQLSYVRKTARWPLKINLPIKIVCLLIRAHTRWEFQVELNFLYTVWSVNDGLSGNLLETSGNQPRRFPAGFRSFTDNPSLHWRTTR